MFKIPRDYRKSFYCALALHVVFFILISIHFSFHHKVSGQAVKPTVVQTKIIQATTVSQESLDQQAEQKRRQQAAAQQAAFQREHLAHERVVKLAAEKKAKQQALQKQKLAQERQAELERQKAAQDARLREHDREVKVAQQKALVQKQAAAKQAAEKAAHEKVIAGEVSHYQSAVLSAIAAHWIIPPGADKKASCELSIQLAPSGKVLEVRLLKSSGNSALDQSAQAAVLQASPLPVPADSDAFQQFQQLSLTMRPQDFIQ